jgi:hypothetical protein
LVIALVVPWLVLLLIAEWGREDRFMFLWPVQVIVLAFVGTMRARSTDAPRRARWLVPLVIVGGVLANQFLLSQLDAWRDDGWSGSDKVEFQVATYLAKLIRAESKDRAWIGRRLFDEAASPGVLVTPDGTSRRRARYRSIANLNTAQRICCGDSANRRDTAAGRGRTSVPAGFLHLDGSAV